MVAVQQSVGGSGPGAGALGRKMAAMMYMLMASSRMGPRLDDRVVVFEQREDEKKQREEREEREEKKIGWHVDPTATRHPRKQNHH